MSQRYSTHSDTFIGVTDTMEQPISLSRSATNTSSGKSWLSHRKFCSETQRQFFQPLKRAACLEFGIHPSEFAEASFRSTSSNVHGHQRFCNLISKGSNVQPMRLTTTLSFCVCSLKQLFMIYICWTLRTCLRGITLTH
jgi:hypothetical protein